MPLDPDKLFEDLTYPGRRKPVNRKAETEQSDTELWDDRPVKYLINGQEREFFQISHLAKALGYSVQAIRLWETQGHLPRTPYRAPRLRGAVAAGSTKGKRLWTRQQIEGIVRIAKKHRVIFPDRRGRRPPPTRSFTAEVAQLFRDLTAP